MSNDLAERILACVEAIPPGCVMTYGDVAEYVGASSPRIVGRVLALDDGGVPWHRVLRANGTLASHLYTEQRQRLMAEGVRFRGERVDLARHRWDGVTRNVVGQELSPDRLGVVRDRRRPGCPAPR